NDERVLRARAWYYTHVFADPVDEDTVYVLNAPFMKSTDGGRSFERVGTPHGDNHDLWIHPEDNRWMINGNDGGANVSYNGGETWSTQANQPTAQFYRLDVDDLFPYRLYAGQQDNSTVSIPSAAPGGIGRADWHAVGGCESAHVAFDPEDPSLVYAGCYQGQISEWNAETRRERSVMAIPFLGLGTYPKDQPYRFNWNAPIEVSPHDPSVLYHAANVLLRSEDRGVTWTEVSPDLTRDEEDKQGPGGEPITNETAGGETYNTIFYIALSPHEEGTIWAGTDDGLVHLTRDGTETWTDVTPPGVYDGRGQVNAIDVSPHDPASAYVAVTRYKLGDYRPYAFKTDDYGASWTAITDGIPEGAWVRVVREDPEVPGLLYAGTETGAYVSFDDGGRWQPLEPGLPVVPVTDLAVQDGDLLASTQGRAFWILDDLAPLRQLAGGGGASEDVAGADLHLFRPSPAVRVSWGGGFGGGGGGAEGENPPPGAVIDYVLSEELSEELAASGGVEGARPEGEPEGSAAEGEEEKQSDPEADPEAGEGPPALELDVLDAEGRVVRSYSSRPEDGGGGGGGGFFGGGPPETLPVEPGMNRFAWDLRGEGTVEVPGLFTLGNAEPMVPPGTYRVRLRVGDREEVQELELAEDPRIDTSGAGYAEQQALLADIRETLGELNDAVLRAREVKEQVESEIARVGDLEEHLEGGSETADAIEESGREIADALAAWEETVVQTRSETFQDIINFQNRLNAQIYFLFGAVDGSGPPVTEGARTRFTALREQWEERRAALREILDEDVAAFNALVEEHRVPAVVVPPPGKHLEDQDEEGE
ncbi:MAG: glycosyl hydrolase, partial [Thermoanaerobaculia bacterium]